MPATSPTANTSISDDVAWVGRGGRAGAASSSFPGGGFDMPAASSVPASGLTTVSVVNLPPRISGMHINYISNYVKYHSLYAYQQAGCVSVIQRC